MVAQRRQELAGLRSIWYRSPSAFQFPAELSPTERHWAMSEAKLGVGGILASLPGVLWINHPSRNADAAYKPVQLATAVRCGLSVPDTLVTNRADAVRRFASGGETVTKALGAPAITEDGGRKTTVTHLLEAADVADLRGIEVTTHQFQRWVPKSYEARVIVAGDRVFAAGIYAESKAAYLDWRNDYSALRYEKLEPPLGVAAGVLEYCVELGLTYGAFDFVIRPDGEWVFLECNPGGQYGWIEDAIADHRDTRRSTDRGGHDVTTTAVPWREHARRLADTLAGEGTLHDPAWRAALEATPRHLFVPRFYVQQPEGEWTETAGEAPDWLDAVYRDQPLITSWATTPNGNRVTVSSSTKPGLMVRMLEVLDVHDGHRVLEIGTGTGYNAALLAHRLGDERVFSVDIGTDLVTDARERLAELGLAPTLVATNGAAGLPDHAPYDRIIATCSVPAVPWAWAVQVREVGLVLVDLKRSTHAGNLVLLRRHADRLEGRFLPKWAGFMSIRGTDAAPDHATALADVEAGARSTTRLEPLPWQALVPWFLVQSQLPHGLTFGYRGAGDNGPEWAISTAGDGSWCAVRMQADDDTREIRQGGPVAIWDAFERAHRQWDGLGRPDWDRLGLTVLSDGLHRVWLDEPDGAYRWPMPPVD